jgi:nitrite reductase (NO-forming)
MRSRVRLHLSIMLAALLVSACGRAQAAQESTTYSLKTAMQDGRMVYIGVGGSIDGVVDPTLTAKVGDVVMIKLTSGDGVQHNISLPDFNTVSQDVVGQGSSTTVVFGADRAGTFPYFCNIAGHRQAGMEGKLEVLGDTASSGATQAPTPASSPVAGSMSMSMAAPAAAATSAAPATGADIVRDPTDLPGPIGNRGPETVQVNLEAMEVVGQLAEGTTFTYWTFNGKVPGPFFRVRVGDTVEVHLKNNASSIMPHSVDFHAVTGPGGGMALTMANPGGEGGFTFKALKPGLYVYHCATPMVAEHIANGMFGMILVEPEGGLPPVDREFYVMQSEIYTTGNYGDQGAQSPDPNKILDERPDYFVFNGAAGALATQKPLQAHVGETVRIFFGVGGPNFTSSFHVIGEIFDRVYNLGSITTPPMTDVQTTLVPPGGGTIVEFKIEVPGKYILVDHAIAREERGLGGWLIADGPDAPDIFMGNPKP